MSEKKIAIVGTSKLDNVEESLCISVCREILEKDSSFLFLYGGANGVDTVAMGEATRLSLPITYLTPRNQRWTPQGFKERNIKIAEQCDIIYSISTPTKTTRCYHCNADHQKTAGCWTRIYAEKLGKESHHITLGVSKF